MNQEAAGKQAEADWIDVCLNGDGRSGSLQALADDPALTVLYGRTGWWRRGRPGPGYPTLAYAGGRGPCGPAAARQAPVPGANAQH